MTDAVFKVRMSFGLLHDEKVPERCSVCPTCRTKLIVIANRRVSAYWCASCRKDVPLTDVISRICWESGPRMIRKFNQLLYGAIA